ncbi:MAG: tetratricopeptide repeat protein [Candidatus Eisenbacteria bacterium]|uniref:Tetratricopeptide repeat protein n=1 Tax=Eiseniibacteriota bacterium TaxID=2212470 RepID=A0A538T4W1_UNCEI|nr:MAG: tetratricopeptide repeat protein [Candidatus Eisenbacteria bacterium]
MIGKTLSHYRIVERIAAGGMGVVHRAWDERLNRDVALKVLPAGALSDDAARERFRREALALSRLNHPHIATIYDLDRQDDVDFLAMEYIPGRTVAQKIAQGAITEAEAASIGCQITEALEEAHDQGIVHGDLKSENVIVTPKGWAKVLDFGLATLRGPVLERAETATYADANVVAGTLPYMAPEQLLSGRTDPRSDLYALGVILYEMGTGRLPFEERLASALVDAICHRPPAPPGEIRPGISRLFESVILRLLEKDSARRYQTARELNADLRRVCSAGPASFARGEAERGTRSRRIESIAVLPLENLSRDPEQDYFADGMTEALIAGLAKIRALRVISRTSVMRYKGARVALAEIARALEVDAIVEGSVLRSGERVRITALLVDTATDRHLWAETYERDMGDILALQSEVAKAIAGEIQVTITPQEVARLARPRAIDPEAYHAYLKGRYHWEKRSEEGLKRALHFFQEAIERDPTYAPAYAGIADYYITLSNYNVVDSHEAYPKGKAAALRALEMDPGSAEAYTSLGSVKGSYEWDRKGAEQDFRRAIALNPNYATAHHWFADHLVSLRRFQEGIAEITVAKSLDPLSSSISADAGGYQFYAGRYDKAIALLEKTLEQDPGFARAYGQLGGIFEQMGKYEEAIEAFKKAKEVSGGATYSLTALTHAYALAGRRDEAERMLQQLEEIGKRKFVSSYSIAAVYVALGDTDRAFDYLDRAVQDHDRALIWLPVAPRFNRVRSDPRFRAILRTVGAE